MVNAFKEIRLTNSFINSTGGVLKVNNELVAYQSETGRLLNYSGILDTRLYQTGSNLLALIAANSAGVSSISVTGHAVQSGAINFTGAGNVIVHTGINNTIIFSGDISSLATISNLQTTGSNLYNYINNFSGVFNNSGAQYQSLINAVTSNLTTTGQNLYNWLTVTSGNNNTTNTNLGSTGSTLYNYIRIFSGNQQSFSTGMTTGFDNYRVDYPLGLFPIVPRVFTSLEISGGIMYNVNITGRTTGNFYALFSDVIAESGVVLHVFATINN